MDVCGGHPRSIEDVISLYNTIIDSADRNGLSGIVAIVTQLIGAYRPVQNHDLLLKAYLGITISDKCFFSLLFSVFFFIL